MAAEPSTVMSIGEVEAFAMRILRANGLADHQAVPIVRAMAAAEASECRSKPAAVSASEPTPLSVHRTATEATPSAVASACKNGGGKA